MPEPHKTNFLEASQLEYDTISQMSAWREVKRPRDAEIPFGELKIAYRLCL